MPRNVILCLDGTGNRLKATGNTSVVTLYSMLDLSDPEKQIAFYDPESARSVRRELGPNWVARCRGYKG